MNDKSDKTRDRSSPGRRTNRTQSALIKVGGAEVIAKGCQMARTMIVARYLTKEMVGIASTITLVVDFLERVFSPHTGMVIVQDPKGGSGHFRRTLQSIMTIRGLLFGALIMLCSVPLAIMNDLDSRVYVAAFIVIGLVPVINGFTNIDISRQYRNRQYGGVTTHTITREVGALVVAIILCLVMTTFWVPVLVRVFAAVIALAASFWLARRRFTYGWSNSDARRIVLFLAPLIGAGLIVFLGGQGPRQLISAAKEWFDQDKYTFAMLGGYVMAMTASNIPANIGGSLIQKSWAPKLARLRDEPAKFQKTFCVVQRFATSIGMASLVLLSAGTVWMVVLFAERYASAGPILAMFAFKTSIRISTVGIRCSILSLGRSSYVMYMNIGGLLGPIGASWVIIQGGSLVEIAFWITMGELLSSIIGNLLLKKCMPSVRVWDVWVIPLLMIGAGALIGYLQAPLIEGLNKYIAACIVIGITGISLIGCLVIFPEIRPRRLKR